jgi:thiol-disulfide isomerase/thioredoxin
LDLRNLQIGWEHFNWSETGYNNLMAFTRYALPLSSSFAICALAFTLVAWIFNAAHAETPTPGKPAIETLPPSRGGQDLIGSRFPALHFDRWLNTENNQPLETNRAVTLYRWWTDTCPYCAATLPAIEKLREKYGAQGLKIVGVYHPKPPREVTDKSVRDAADRIGYKGAIAIDADWSQLRKLYLSTGRRGATSVSFLVDREGVIRFVHPGVEYFPSDKPEDAEQNSDFQLIDKAIATLLATEEKPKK